MVNAKKIDQVIHTAAQKSLEIGKKGVKVVSEGAAKVKKSIEEGDSFLTEEQHQNIDKAAQNVKEKVKGFFKKK